LKRTLRNERAGVSQQLLLAFDSVQPAFTAHDALPGSERRIAMANQIIVYRLHRVRRRTIGFQINERGLTVRAPRSIAMREIEAAIVENQRWIFAKQLEWRAWCERQRLSAIRFADGGTVQYLGKVKTLRLGAAVARSDAEIHLTLPDEASEADVRQALQAWLQAQARSVIGERVERFSERMQARFAGWRLSSARTQWGSCSHDGRVRLNWRLVHFPLPVIDYVIAHELAHLRELNHSPRFWREVARLLPGFEAARDQIKRVEIGSISF
jgi:predicted metal-dependent hydrolase